MLAIERRAMAELWLAIVGPRVELSVFRDVEAAEAEFRRAYICKSYVDFAVPQPVSIALSSMAAPPPPDMGALRCAFCGRVIQPNERWRYLDGHVECDDCAEVHQ